MKTLTTLAFVLLVATLTAQDNKYADSYVCKNGKTHFFSATTMENIEATSKTTMCVMNTKSKKVFAKITQTSFVFKDKLMQEHFNENYMESEKYPTATLDMMIAEDIDYTKDGTYDITLKGILEMHGVKKDREIKGKLTVKKGQPVNATAVFDVVLSDHKIKIPSVIGQNIAESIKVDVDLNFEKYQK